MSVDGPDPSDRGELVRWQDEIDFRDLIYGMAESVSEAQVELDRNLAATMVEFAGTTVDVVPRVTRTIDAEGRVTHTPSPTEKRSLLDLDLTPTRYQFSEATVDVEFDISFVVDETEKGNETRKARFRVDTSEAHHRRRYHGEANTTAKISARLVPVPTPAALTPATVEPTPESTTGDDDSGEDADANGETSDGTVDGRGDRDDR
jgi:hypothetical protein